jgi:outer membrane protein assembly factor BamA
VSDDVPAQEPVPPRRRRWRRRVLRGLGAVPIVLLIVLHLPPVQRALVSAALTPLKTRQHLDLDYRAVRFNLLTRQVHIDGLRLGATGAPAPLVSATVAQVRFPWSGFRGSLDGLDVTLTGAVVTLARANGTWVTIPPAWTKPSTGGTSRRLPAFAALRLHDTTVVYEDHDAHFREDTRHLSVDLIPTGSGEAGDLAGDLQPGATTVVRWEPRGTTLIMRRGRARFSTQGTGIDGLVLDAPEGRITTDVKFAFKGQERFGLTAQADLKADQLAGWVAALQSAEGNLHVALTMPSKGGGAAFSDVVVTGPRVVWRHVVATDLSAAGPLETRAVTLTRASLMVSGGRVDGSARLVWSGQEESSARLRGENVDVGALLRTLVPDSAAVARLAPASLVSGAFEGRWSRWDADALSGHVQSQWRPRPSGFARTERLQLDGPMSVSFVHGPWIVDMDNRANGAVNVRGRWTLRSSTKDFGDWPIAGDLRVAGATSGAVHTGLFLFETAAPVDLAQATGDIGGTVQLSGTLGRPIAYAVLSGTIAWPDQPDIVFSTTTRADTRAVTVERFDATSGPSRANGVMQIDLVHHTMDSQFTGQAVAVESWLRRFDLSIPASGPVDVTGRVTGPLSRWTIDADVHGGPVLLAGQPMDRVSGHVRYDGRAIVSDQVHLWRGDGVLVGGVEWTRGTRALAATFDATDVPLAADLPGLSRPDGTPGGALRALASGHIVIGGSTDVPTYDLDLTAPHVRLDDEDLGPATVRLTPENALTARAPALGLAVSGTVDIGRARAFNVTARVDTPDSPLRLRPAGGVIDLGAMALTARAAGQLGTPRLESLDLAIDRLDAQVERASPAGTTGADPALRLALQARGHARYEPDRLTADQLTIVSGPLHLMANGTLGSPNATLAADLHGRLEDVRPLVLAFVPAGWDALDVAGPVRVHARANGSVRDPVLSASLEVDGARVRYGTLPELSEVWVRMALDRSEIRMDLIEGRWQGAHIALSGTVPAWFAQVPGAVRTGARAHVAGHVDEVTLRVLEPFVPPAALQATTFSARVEFKGEADRPEMRAITADLDVPQLVLKSRDLGLAQRQPGHMHLAGELLTIDPWTIGAPWSTRTLGTLAGTVRMPTGGQPAALDLHVDGRFDLRAAGLLLGTYRPGGSAEVNARITGTTAAPNVDGMVRLVDAELLVRQPRLLLSDVNGVMRFSGDRLMLDDLHGTMNGGSLTASGSMRQPGRGAPDGALALAIRGALLDIPHGLRSAVDADLTFREQRPLATSLQPRRFLLGGTVTIVQAAYHQDLLVTGGLLSWLQGHPDVPVAGVAGDRSALSSLGLDVRVVAQDSVSFDTTYGRFDVGANVRVLGSPDRLRLSGLIDVAQGGELYFGGRTYHIESARAEFRNQTTLQPDVRLVARTSVGGYDVTMQVESRDGATETTLTSDPPLPQDEIASLMLTGERNSSSTATEAVTEQLLASLSGEIVGAVGRAIGFDSVRVEYANPADTLFDTSLISSVSNPTQRLTFSKHVFPELEVIVSQSLRQSGDITWILAWKPVPSVELRFVQLDDLDRSYEIRNDLSFGGGAPPRKRAKIHQERVEAVEVSVTGTGTTEAEVRAQLRVKVDKPFDFYNWQRDRDRWQERLFERGYYQARVTTRRDPPAPPPGPGTSTVRVRYRIDTGPKTMVVVNGVAVPNTVVQQLLHAWSEVPVDSLVGEEFTAVLRPWLAMQGYLHPEVSVEVAQAGDTKTATVTVVPGTQYTERIFEFEGNGGIDDQTLEQALRLAGLADRAFLDPVGVDTTLLALYRGRGYLSAKIAVDPPVTQAARATLRVRVDEGPQYIVGSVRVDGASVPWMESYRPIWEGKTLTDRDVADAVRQMQLRYRREGYRTSRVAAKTTTRPDGHTVDLVFSVKEGPRSQLGTLTVAGASPPSERLIARTARLASGEPISSTLINQARDRLYDTGLFRTVSLETTPRAAEGPVSNVLDATLSVEELPRYRFRYGFQLFDPNSPIFTPKWGSVDPGAVADLTRRGLFGLGLTGGVGARVNPSERNVRAYLSSRTFLGLPAQTNLYIGEERQKTGSGLSVLTSSSREITFEQRVRRRRLLQIGYGYGFERVNYEVLVDLPTLPFPVPVEVKANIGRLLGSLVVDRRDTVINTRQGLFHSSSVELGPTALGSTEKFNKYLAQQFHFVPWKRVTLASAARFEFSGGPGRGVITTDRLRVGGAYTVRGYEDDTVTLSSVTSTEPGKTEILVLNQEVRFPLTRRLQGTTFWDYAAIYGDIGDFAGITVRNSLGLGVRVVLPFILLRVDYGYPLRQDAVNDRGRWYFAIGQAF